MPIFTLVAVFSAIERVVVVPAVNTGARFSSTSVILMVTVMLSVKLPSETVIVTV